MIIQMACKFNDCETLAYMPAARENTTCLV